ncbi:Crp/Fnr family transcriptional regulator [Alcaligenaceae bacterium CGII-47]|nr:Crp/Fnr family transcriptional regulator [Alcaligenaceae bacterium CGII-47]
MTNIKFPSISTPSVLEHGLFRGIPADVGAMLLRDSATLHVQARDVLFREGDSADEYLFVQTGSVEVLRHTQEGQERVFQIFEARRLLAETAMFMKHGRYPMCARARSDTIVLCLKRTALHAACQAYPELAMRMLQRLSDRIYERVNDIEWFSDSTSAQRLAAYLLELRSRVAQPQAQDLMRLPLTQRQLATHLGVRAETLSRLLAEWSAQGIVKGQRRDWAVCNEVFLRELAQSAQRDF